MKFIITQKQYQLLKENLDDVLDLYSKKGRGETLRPSEMDVLRAFDKHQKKEVILKTSHLIKMIFMITMNEKV